MKPDLVSVDPLPLGFMDRLAEDFTVHRLPPPAGRAAFFAGLGERVRFVQTTGFVKTTRDIIDALPKLEIIGVMAVGVDAVDLAAARARKIIVTNTPEVLNECVADLAIGLLIATARRLPQADRYLREGAWQRGMAPLASRVSGKRLGILGLGRIGKAIAKRAAGFDMEIAYHTRNRQTDVPYTYFADLVEMARWSDFLLVMCPGGEATRNLVNAAVLEALGPEGTLINAARGSVVDEPALVQALKEKKLGAAGLDVFANEPNVPAELLGMDNVVLLPHVGSATVETRSAMAELVIENLRRHLRGQAPLTPVP